ASSSSTMADIGFPAFRQNKDTRSCQNLVIGCGNIIQRTSISATNVAARQHHAFAVIVSAGPFWSLKIVQLAQALNWRTVLGEISERSASSQPISLMVPATRLNRREKQLYDPAGRPGWRIFVVI